MSKGIGKGNNPASLANLRRIVTHGLTDSREYRIWTNMKTRCLNKGTPAYKRYGARGIIIWSPWINSFKTFYADMGPCPEGFTLERKDSNGPYSPQNCVWADWFQQQNNRTNNRKITFNGKTQNIGQWEHELGLTQGVIGARLRLGRSLEDAMAQRDLRLEHASTMVLSRWRKPR